MSEHQTMIRSLENLRAEFALQCVKKAKDEEFRNSETNQKKYKGYIKKIPVYIQTNGLGNTLAFVKEKSKKEKAYELIYTQLSNWLQRSEIVSLLLPQKEANQPQDLVELVIKQPSSIYRHLAKELLALLKWMKRLSEAMIEGDDYDEQ